MLKSQLIHIKQSHFEQITSFFDLTAQPALIYTAFSVSSPRLQLTTLTYLKPP
jgi:hypothetical protein